MAIAFDAASTGEKTTSSTSITVSHTCTGNNLILFVGVGTFDSSAGQKVSGVTYNGVAMTQIGTRRVAGSLDNTLWYLINPATGTHDIVASYASQNECYLVAASYTGAKQTGQPDATAGNAGQSSTAITAVVTTVADNCWVVMSATCNSLGLAAGASTTMRVSATPNDAIGFFDNNAAKTPAGAVTLTATGNTTSNTTSSGASFAPAVSGPTNMKTYNTNPIANVKTMNTNPIANVKSFDTNT